MRNGYSTASLQKWSGLSVKGAPVNGVQLRSFNLSRTDRSDPRGCCLTEIKFRFELTFFSTPKNLAASSPTTLPGLLLLAVVIFGRHQINETGDSVLNIGADPVSSGTSTLWRSVTAFDPGMFEDVAHT